MGQRAKPARVRSGRGTPPGGTGTRTLIHGVLLATTSLLATAWLVQLGLQAARGTFATDECFHAYVAQWIVTHHRLPTIIPELYSGFYYYYQPMLHLIGALAVAVAGAPSLHLLPTCFAAATFLALWFATPRSVSPAARAGAVLLCLGNRAFAEYAVRFYVEGLTTLEFALGAALLLRHEASGRRRDALWLGVLVAAAMLTKFTGWLLLILVVARAGWLALRGSHRRAVDLAIAAGLAILASMPWLIRNQTLFGSALYPAFAPDMDRALYTINLHRFSVPAQVFLVGTPRLLGMAVVCVALAAIAVAAWRRDGSDRAWLLGFALVGLASVAFTPMASARHLDPFLPVLALAATAILFDALESRRLAETTLAVALLIPAAMAVLALPEVRRPVDEQPYMRDALAAVRLLVPPSATVLSLWTYDTFYHGGCHATWPIPWGQRVHPVEMFTETDPDRWLAELRRYDIRYVLMPSSTRSLVFDSANYPRSFLAQVDSLLRRGALDVTWSSGGMILVGVRDTVMARDATQ
ncbi:MAG: hypothetical protein ACHQ52_06750 [Candidatus Eisenbacteria bacterium]